MVRRGGQGSRSSKLLVMGDPPRGGPGYFMGGPNLGGIHHGSPMVGSPRWAGDQGNGSSCLVRVASPFHSPKGAPATPPPRSLPGAQSVRCCFWGVFPGVGGGRQAYSRGGASPLRTKRCAVLVSGPRHLSACMQSLPKDTALDASRPIAEPDP